MITGSCPRCQGKVSIPDDLGAEVHVQCPLCRVEFQLSEVADQIAPPLVIVDDVNLAPNSEDTVAAERTNVSPVSMDPKRTFDFGADHSSQHNTDMVSPQQMSSRKEGPRKSVAIEFIKIFLGGVAGILIALMIMLWGLRIDPFHLGPLMPPSIVPEKFQARDGSQKNSSRLWPPSLGGSDSGFSFGSGPADSADNRVGGASSTRDGAGDSSSMTPESKESESANVVSIQTNLSEFDVDIDVESNRLVQVRDAPAYSQKDIEVAWSAADRAHQEWDKSQKSPSAVRRRIARDFYERFCELGDRLAYSASEEKDAENSVDTIHEMLLKISDDLSLISVISAGASNRLGPHAIRYEGVFLTGTVAQVDHQGRFVIARIAPGNKKDLVIPVISSMRPLRSLSNLPQGGQVLVLGAVIRDPSTQIMGYAGDDPIAILNGMTVVIAEPPTGDE